MDNKNVSTHFTLGEFTKRYPYDLTTLQMYMVSRISSRILEPIREYLNKMLGGKISIVITSAIRDEEEYLRLKSKGYHPSETSDHFYGQSILIDNKDKQDVFGKLYNYTVGAVDFTIPGQVMGAVFAILANKARSNKTLFVNYLDLEGVTVEFGQLIYETNGKTSWIHISNPKYTVYGLEFCTNYLSNKPLLTSKDGGKSYEEYKG